MTRIQSVPTMANKAMKDKATKAMKAMKAMKAPKVKNAMKAMKKSHRKLGPKISFSERNRLKLNALMAALTNPFFS